VGERAFVWSHTPSLTHALVEGVPRDGVSATERRLRPCQRETVRGWDVAIKDPSE
jgi:hypothetical protein